MDEILTVSTMGQTKDLSPAKKHNQSYTRECSGQHLFCLGTTVQHQNVTCSYFDCFSNLYTFQSFMNTRSENGEERDPGVFL